MSTSTTKRWEKSCNTVFKILEYEDHVTFEALPNFAPHSHSLDESDADKRPSFLMRLVGQEVAKGYAAATVISAIRGGGDLSALARLKAIGGAYLTRQDVRNSGAAWRLAHPNALFVTALAKDDVSMQVREAFSKLEELHWVSAPVSAVSLDKVSGNGVVFAAPHRLPFLERHGYLTLVDSTHKTNQLEWKLFTLMVRDAYACWRPVAHAFLSNEFGELIAEFLLVIKRWAPNWSIRYALSDDSAAEQKAFRLAFPGLAAGETEVSASDR